MKVELTVMHTRDLSPNMYMGNGNQGIAQAI